MDQETRKEITLHGIRLANNILVEVLSNHAAAVNVEGRKYLSEAVKLIAKADSEFRSMK
jgi:hypothetical protein